MSTPNPFSMLEIKESLGAVRTILDEISADDLKKYFAETYDSEPPADFDCYGDLEAFENIVCCRGSIPNSFVVQALVKVDRLGFTDLVRSLTKRVTPDLVQAYFAENFVLSLIHI